MVSTGVTPSGFWTGKHYMDEKIGKKIFKVTFGYLSISGVSGAPTSRPVRHGPNGVVVIDAFIPVLTSAIIIALLVAVIRVITSPIRTKDGKLDALTLSNGLPVGSAVAIVLRDAMDVPGLGTTGVAVGTSAASAAESSDKKPYTDDLAGVAVAYTVNGTRGMSVAGSPVMDKVLGHVALGSIYMGSPHGGGSYSSGI